MIGFLPWLPLLPAALPLLLALCAMLIPSPRWLALLVSVSLLCASVPFWPLAGIPRQTPTWLLLTVERTSIVLQLSTGGPDDPGRAGLALLVLIAAALGL